MTATNTPYETLVPDRILNAIESLDYVCSGTLLALNSYENRVYQVGIEESAPLVAKFYRPNRWTDDAILEEHEFALELQSHEIPIIAPLKINGKTLHEYEGFRFALFPRQGGHALEIDNLAQLEQMGRFIGRLHAVGSTRSFQHRHRMDVETFGYQPCHYLKENNFIPPELLHNFSLAFDAALQMASEQFQQAKNFQTLRLHGDCHAGNILWKDNTLHIVDLDDCMTGPAIQDLWMMLSGPTHDTKIQLTHLLNGYDEFHDFDRSELHLIEALRTLRMIHYAGWLAKRWKDPAFPISFPWFNTPRYWETLLHNLREQVAVLNG